MRKGARRPCTKNPGKRKHIIVPKRTKVGPLRKKVRNETLEKYSKESASLDILRSRLLTYRN